MTLTELITQHPEWANLPLTVYRPDGELDYVGASGAVYEGEYNGEKVLIFAGN